MSNKDRAVINARMKLVWPRKKEFIVGEGSGGNASERVALEDRAEKKYHVQLCAMINSLQQRVTRTLHVHVFAF